jgi:hypothetical protein
MRAQIRAVLFPLAVMTLGSALWAQPAAAQVHPGVRAGVSVNPDQVYIGGHIETSPLIDRLRFRPNVEIGFGDNVTLTTFNFEFVYGFPSRGPWHLYAGGGPSVNFFRVNSNTNSEGGFNLLVGTENRHGLFFEGKFGVASGADVKFGVGYTFH